MQQSNWLKARRQLLEEVKRQVQSRVGPAPKDISAYIRRYNAEFFRPWARSDQNELLAAVRGAQIVLGADFHAFNQSQRIHLRILRELPLEQSVLLAMEALPAAAQKTIDQFMGGGIAEGEFLERIRWDRTWGFPWANYRPLMEFARERKLRVIGLGDSATAKGPNPLSRRETFSARIISQTRKDYPSALIYVIIGDLHLARSHLPKALGRVEAEKPDQIVTVLQNSEHLYFRLARRGREHEVDVMRAKGDRYCVLSSPPWVKWQSYLMYLEQTYDRDLDNAGADFSENVGAFAIFIARDLGMDVCLDDLHVVSVDDSGAWLKKMAGLPARKRRYAEVLMGHERSFFVPEIGSLFLTRASINHASTLAGYFLLGKISGLERAPWNFPEDFEASIWLETFGFLASKLINHKRKAELPADWVKELKGGARERREILSRCVRQRSAEIKGQRGPGVKASGLTYLESARLLGFSLGEKIYGAVSRSEITLEQVGEIFKINPLSPDFHIFYYDFCRRLFRRKRRGSG